MKSTCSAILFVFALFCHFVCFFCPPSVPSLSASLPFLHTTSARETGSFSDPEGQSNHKQQQTTITTASNSKHPKTTTNNKQTNKRPTLSETSPFTNQYFHQPVLSPTSPFSNQSCASQSFHQPSPFTRKKESTQRIARITRFRPGSRK